jgi:hypothetical protein
MNAQGNLPTTLPSVLYTAQTITRRAAHIKLQYIADYCSNLRDHGLCAVCYHIDSPHKFTRHNAYACPLELTTPDTIYHTIFKTNLTFVPGTACYLCGFLFMAPTYHPLHEPDTPINIANCPWPDLLKPIAYIAWHNIAIRTRVFERLEINPPSLQEYARWLGQRVQHEPPLLNIHLVVFEVMRCESSTSPRLQLGSS